MNLLKNLSKFLCLAVFAFAIVACEDGTDGLNGTNGVDGQNGQDGQDGQDGQSAFGSYNWSNTDALVTTFPGFNNVKVSSLLSSTDVLTTASGGSFQLGGSADGAGAVLNSDGNIAMMVNCEDHYSVVRVILDPETLEPIQGDYMLNSGVNEFSRQCSGTMWESAIHGGSEDFFISSSENWNLQSKRIDIEETPNPTANDDRFVEWGRFNWENNVPLPAGAYSGSTVVIGGDDDSSGSEGQIALYYSQNGDADLTGGKVYVLRRVGATAVETEEDLDFGVEYDVEFVEIPNAASLTYAETEQACVDALSLQFMRVEDVDYGKGSDADGRTVFFAVTGRGPNRGTYNDWGTGYKLVLDDANPLTGKLTQIISGNTDTNKMDGNMPFLQSPDNICVTDNYIYWQEDPNSFDRGHQAYIWQSDLNGNNIVPVLQIDYNEALDIVDGSLRAPDGLNGEFGALFDMTDKVTNANGTVFALMLQPHYWEEERFEGIDGHVRTVFDGVDQPGGGREDDQGSQIVILEGLPK